MFTLFSRFQIEVKFSLWLGYLATCSMWFLDARLHSREKRRLASSCPTVCPYVSARLPLHVKVKGKVIPLQARCGPEGG